MPTTPLTTGLAFDSDQQLIALRDVEDLVDRSLAPMILLRDTAASLVNNGQLDCQEICVGIRTGQLTREVLSVFETYKPEMEETDWGWRYKSADGMPISIQKLHKNYEFFRQPDFVFFWGGTYLVPNPFDKYWKTRFIVT